MNITNLTNPVVQARIYAAMRMAVNAANGLPPSAPKSNIEVETFPFGYGLCKVKNKKGEVFLSVYYDNGSCYRGLSGFTFVDSEGNWSNDVVIQSLRMN